MAIIGEVIKGAIKIAGSLTDETNHIHAQQKTLIQLLKTPQYPILITIKFIKNGGQKCTKVKLM